MEITKINFNVGQSQSKKSEQAAGSFSSNPFGVSFKGNVIQADVFEKAAPKLTNKLTEKGKLFASAIVGNVNNFNNSLKSRMNAIVSFGQKIKTNVVEAFDKAANTEISLDFEAFANTIKNRFFPDSQYKVKNLVKMPVSDLKNLWKAEMIG